MNTLKLLFLLAILFGATEVYTQNYEIYVSDAGNWNNPPWQIAKFDENGENPEAFITDSLVWPQDIVFLEDQGVVLISNLTTNGYISRHDISTGDFVNYFAEDIAGPTRMKIGEDSLLYVLQWSNTDNNVLRYKLDGTFVDEFTSTGVRQGIGLDWDSDGNLYVSSYGGKYVQKYDTAGNDLGKFIETSLEGPTNIWFEENGDLMVIDYNGGDVKRFDNEGTFLEVFIDGLENPEGIDFFPDGRMLIGDGGTSAVKRFEPDGDYVDDFIPSGSGGLLIPNAIVIRNVTSVSVPENKRQRSFISPTVGRRFLFHNELVEEMGSFEIYNAFGMLVEKGHFNGSAGWNANYMADGMYVVIARTADGMVKRQKVIVR
jgi:DNA-binding beta-propeller fold protein YncE